MSYSVTVELPDSVFQALEQQARDRSTSVEALVSDTVAKLFSLDGLDESEITDAERHASLEAALRREDLWGSDADRHWDQWKP
jgi:hypothetical protein